MDTVNFTISTADHSQNTPVILEWEIIQEGIDLLQNNKRTICT